MIEFEYIKDILVKNKFAIFAFLLSIVSIVGSAFYVHANNCDDLCNEVNNVEVSASKDSIAVADVDSSNKAIRVDVKGAVKKPGVYEMNDGSTIIDAITSAGGVSSKGTTININLSKKLSDEMVVYVFTKDEIKKRTAANEVVCEVPKCECETVEVSSCTDNINGNNNSSNSNEKSDTKEDISKEEKKVSLNKGTVADFTTLDGIGESKAQAIIEYRNTNGPFEKIEDIMNVSGIGEKAFEKIKDKLML